MSGCTCIRQLYYRLDLIDRMRDEGRAGCHGEVLCPSCIAGIAEGRLESHATAFCQSARCTPERLTAEENEARLYERTVSGLLPLP